MHRRPLMLLLATVLPLAGQTAQPPLPNSDLRDPAGQKVLYRFHTLPNSVQVYTCRLTDGAFVWATPYPDAILADDANKLMVHHYKGPVWEATDGSTVRSEVPLAKHFLPTHEDAIHWLELPAKATTGQFGGVTFIHRIDTAGGLLPRNTPCDAQHARDEKRVAYSATYLFYGPQ